MFRGRRGFGWWIGLWGEGVLCPWLSCFLLLLLVLLSLLLLCREERGEGRINGDTEVWLGGGGEEGEKGGEERRVALLCRLSRSTSNESRRVREPCQTGISSDALDRVLLRVLLLVLVLVSSVAGYEYEYEGGEEGGGLVGSSVLLDWRRAARLTSSGI